MPHTLGDFQTRVDVLLKDAAQLLGAPDKDSAIAQAAVLYSNDRRRIAVEDLPGTGFYDLFLPDDWDDGYSSIKSVLYPLNQADERNSAELESEDWEIYQKPEGKVLRLLQETPQIGETIRIKFTARHSIPTEGESTIPDGDFDAVCNLAASLAFEQLAALKVQSGDPTLGADAVNYPTKSDAYRKASMVQLGLYQKHIGINQPVQAASGTAHMSQDLTVGLDKLTHPRRTQ